MWRVVREVVRQQEFEKEKVEARVTKLVEQMKKIVGFQHELGETLNYGKSDQSDPVPAASSLFPDALLKLK